MTMRRLDSLEDCGGSNSPAIEMLPLRVVLLTNLIAPYTLPVWRELSRSVGSVHFLFSTAMHADRGWVPNCDGLNVRIQRSLSTIMRRQQAAGFTDDVPVDFPYDTLLWLRRLQPDVVISAQLGFRTLQAVFHRLCINRKSRLVIWADLSEHTERGIGRFRTAIRRFLLHAADAVLVNGSSGARYVGQLGVSSKRIIQAPYTTDMTSFESIPLTRELSAVRRFLYVGQLIPRKGLETFLNSLSRWVATHPKQSCEIWFVGDGPLRNSLEQFPLPPSISRKFFGKVPYTELSKYFAEAGVLVLPTLEDTWALVVNEALASGLPVLGSLYSQAVNELVRDNVNGWIFRPDNPESAQDALSRVFATSSERLYQMRGQARKSITHLTPAFVASRFVQAIQIATDECPVIPADCVVLPSVHRQLPKTGYGSGK